MPNPRTAATLMALGRLAFGIGLVASPERVASGWVGEDARRAPAKLLIRGLGARDVALSAGALASLEDVERLRPWIAAAVLADLSDVGSTLVTRGDALPSNARWGTVVLGGGAALAGLAWLAAERS